MPNRICVDIRVTSIHYGASWTYGPCSFDVRDTKENDDTAIYVEKCCVSEKENTLTCRDSGKRGWRGEYLEIQGHKYCNDFFTGYNARRKITILGMHLHLKIQFISIKYNVFL